MRSLLTAGYHLYDMGGRRLAPNVDVQRVYHCLALPQEMQGLANKLEMPA